MAVFSSGAGDWELEISRGLWVYIMLTCVIIAFACVISLVSMCGEEGGFLLFAMYVLGWEL